MRRRVRDGEGRHRAGERLARGRVHRQGSGIDGVGRRDEGLGGGAGAEITGALYLDIDVEEAAAGIGVGADDVEAPAMSGSALSVPAEL